MEHSSSNVKKVLIFSQKKAFLNEIKKTTLIFQETNLSSSKFKKLLIF